MKKTSIFLTVVTIVAAMVFACVSKNNDVEGHKRIATFEQVGIQHNQGLDSIFNELMKERIRLFEESVNQLSTRSISDSGFPKTYNFDALIHRETKKLTKKWYPETSDEFMDAVMLKQSLDSRTRSSSIDRKSEIIEMLTPFQQECYNRLLELLDRKGQSVKRFVADVIALENVIIKNAPTKEEAEQLMFTTSIARNSAEYWEGNAKKWAGMLNGEIINVYPPNKAATRTSGDPSEPEKLNDGYYPHPDNPNMFYYVVDGISILMRCPDGLVFNPKICACDWPENVFDWGEVAKGDVNGAIVGAAGGAAAGAMVGGVGALPGADRGAIAGGAYWVCYSCFG